MFGDENPHGSQNTGYLDFDDAQLLAFPVRSLKGGFLWLTSPLLLNRFARAVSGATLENEFTGLQTLTLGVPAEQGKVLLSNAGKGAVAFKPLGKDEEFVYLEEYALKVGAEPSGLASFAGALAKHAIGPIAGQEANPVAVLFRDRLAVAHDDTLLHFTQHATEVQANIKIEDATGVTTDGSLRYTEYLPSETVLFGRISAQTPGFGMNNGDARRVTEHYKTAEDLLAALENALSSKPLFTFGADRSTGKGLCRFSLAVRK
jgi:CRISPR-associated protein Cmr4